MSDDEGSVRAGKEEHVAGKKRPRSAIQGPIAEIAQPMAGKKMHKRVYKVVSKAAGAKLLRRGVKEVVKAVRKGEGKNGLCVIAGDIAPLDVISHIPVLCEDSSVPYVYVSSKAELGSAASTKRPTSVVLVQGKANSSSFSEQDKLKECIEEAKAMAPEAAKL